jgi:hypothetical protein
MTLKHAAGFTFIIYLAKMNFVFFIPVNFTSIQIEINCFLYCSMMILKTIQQNHFMISDLLYMRILKRKIQC